MGLARELRNRREIENRIIEVPAWGEKGKPFVMYCGTLSCYDLDKLQKKHPKFLENTTIGAMVDLIIMKAVDEAGDLLFKPAEDRQDLMGEETTVISEIANQMFADIESPEAVEKN